MSLNLGNKCLFIFRTRDKTDWDVIRENHQFLWEENDSIETWGKKIAKKYYDKLFKEYCICDLSRYKDGQVRYCQKKKMIMYYKFYDIKLGEKSRRRDVEIYFLGNIRFL